MPEADVAKTVRHLGADLDLKVLAFDVDDFNDETIQAARSRRIAIFVDRLDAADNETQWGRAIEQGAAAIQTNHPAALVEYLARRGLHSHTPARVTAR